jgi:ABC-type phosphate transport system substrate-binding protein
MNLRVVGSLFAWWLLGFGVAHAQVLIANPNVKINELSKSDLRDIFTGVSATFKDGSRVVPALLKGGAAHEEFLKAYIGKNDASFRAGWRAIMFAGQGAMPQSFATPEALIQFVSSVPGAIGYLGSGANPSGVKILVVK